MATAAQTPPTHERPAQGIAMNDKSHGNDGKYGTQATLNLINPMNLIIPMTHTHL